MANKLSDEDITDLLKEIFSITVGREQLSKPTKDFVVNIYARFLAEFGVENVSQPDIVATTGMDNIDRYETNLLLWNIFKSVANIVANDGIPDMTFADVCQPTRVRTNRILSSLCKLLIRLTQIEQRFHQMQQKCVDLPIRRQAVEQRIRELKRQMEDKSTYLSSNKSRIQANSQELKELAETFEKKKTASDLLSDETKQIKSSIFHQREKLSELDIELSQIREQIQDLDQKIVKSPERIQADTDDKEEELETKRNEKKKLEKQYMELIKSIDHLKEISKTLKPSLEAFIEAFKDIEAIRTECQKLSDIKATFGNREEKMKSLKVQIKEQEKSCQTLRQQSVNNSKQFQQQYDTLKQITDGMKMNLETKLKNQSEFKKQCVEERLRLESRLDALDGQHQVFIETYERLSKQMEERLRNCQTSLMAHMNEVKAMRTANDSKNI